MKIAVPADSYEVLKGYRAKKQEHFLMISLNGAHEVIRKRVITKGLVNRTIIHPREIFHYAIKDFAVAIIVAHNHPSGDTTPSYEDWSVTKRLREAGDVLGIRVLDHIIISKTGYYSFLESADVF